ncbi:hypothetical protein HDV02_005875, partial [Globomyces sp. JEL0801]
MEKWHQFLGLPRHSKQWYRIMLRGEIKELHQAKTRLERLSERSDVYYALQRAQFDGYPIRKLDSFRPKHLVAISYMVAKYTNRWLYYRLIGWMCGSKVPFTEVVNPKKEEKLVKVAIKY